MFSWIIFTKRVCLLGGEQNFQNLFLTSSTTLKMVTKKTPKTCLNMWILIEVVITWFKRPCSNSIQQNANISFFQMHRTLWDSRKKFPCTPHQQMVDGMHCIIPGRVAHRCVALARTSTAELLTVKWIQLQLIISWRFEQPQGVINFI